MTRHARWLRDGPTVQPVRAHPLDPLYDESPGPLRRSDFDWMARHLPQLVVGAVTTLIAAWAFLGALFTGGQP